MITPPETSPPPRDRLRQVATMWSPLRLAYGLLPLLEVLRRQQVDGEPLLTAAGIARFGLTEPGYTIRLEQEIRVWQAAIPCLGGPAPSLEVARAYRLRGFSVLGLAMQACDSPLHMLQLILRYPRLAWGMFDSTMELSTQQLHMRFAPQPRLGAAEGFLAERDFACVVVLSEEALGASMPLLQVRFRHRAPAQPEAYAAFFGCPVQFGCRHNELICARDAAEQPLPQAEPMIRQFYEAQCARMSSGLEQPFRYGQTVREHLLRANPVSDLETLAASLFLTPRTLQRRLAAEGERFSTILQDVRATRARQLLTDNRLPLQQIAAELGFSDAVAFSHAFRSWTGVSPGQWRQQHASS